MYWFLYEESIRSEVMNLEDKKMNYRITEDWLADVFETFLGFFDEQEVRALDIPGMEASDNLARVVAKFYARRIHNIVSRNMDLIPTDTIIKMETLEKKASVESISRVKGYVLYYEPLKSSKGFGVTELSELWILEDGRFAEVTSICFLRNGQFHIHRKFRKIIKHRRDIWFKLKDLEDALFLICLAGMTIPENSGCK